MTSFQDDVANPSTWAYDAKDRPTTMTYPDDTAIAYVYDAADRVTEVTDAAGNRVTVAYPSSLTLAYA